MTVAEVDRALRAGRPAAALAALSRLIDAAPTDVGLRRRRRMALAQSGRTDEAEAEARRVVILAPGDEPDWRHLGHIRMRLSDADGAFVAARRAIRLDRRQPRGWATAFVAAAAAGPGATLAEEASSSAFSEAAPEPETAPPATAGDGPAVGVPWALPAYAPYSGAHPVIVSIFAYPNGLTPRRTAADAPFAPQAATALLPRLTALLRDAPTPAQRAATAEFLIHRLPLYFYRHPPADLTFFHTVPFGADGRPWVFHLEQLNVLHAPMISYPDAVIMPDAPWVDVLRRLFREPACLGVFTHIRRTRALFVRLFADPIITAKTACIRFGFDPAPAEKKRPGAPYLRRLDRRRVVLFTNSLNGDNFALRGGPDMLTAFAALHRRRPEIHLLMRSRPPADWPAATAGRWLRHPGVTWLTERLSDAETDALYRAAGVFALPSGLLHAVSLVRALRCGMVTVASDAFGVEEFIRDGVNGLTVRGRRAFVAADVAGALTAEDCRRLAAATATVPDPIFQRRFRAALDRALTDDRAAAHLARNAALGASRDHDGRRWSREAGAFIRRVALQPAADGGVDAGAAPGEGVGR